MDTITLQKAIDLKERIEEGTELVTLIENAISPDPSAVQGIVTSVIYHKPLHKFFDTGYTSPYGNIVHVVEINSAMFNLIPQEKLKAYIRLFKVKIETLKRLLENL